MDQRDIDAIVRRALEEDLPDITSEATPATPDAIQPAPQAQPKKSPRSAPENTNPPQPKEPQL